MKMTMTRVFSTVGERKAIEVHYVPGDDRCNILGASAVLDVQVITYIHLVIW